MLFKYLFHLSLLSQYKLLRAATLSAPSFRTISKAVSTIITFVIFAFGGIIPS